jgi:hypothetical protein
MHVVTAVSSMHLLSNNRLLFQFICEKRTMEISYWGSISSKSSYLPVNHLVSTRWIRQCIFQISRNLTWCVVAEGAKDLDRSANGFNDVIVPPPIAIQEKKETSIMGAPTTTFSIQAKVKCPTQHIIAGLIVSIPLSSSIPRLVDAFASPF